MQVHQRAVAAVSSFISSFLGAWASYRFAEGAGGIVTIGAFYVVGFLLGCVHGLVFGRSYVKTVGYGALAAVLLLWAPVVVVTYGFALLGTPLVVAYAAFLAIGARLVATNIVGKAQA